MTPLHLDGIQSSEKVKNIANVFEETAKRTTLGHSYIVISKGSAEISKSKKHATSFKELTSYVQNILSDKKISIEEKARITQSFKIITERFENKPLSFFYRLFFAGRKKRQVKEAQSVINPISKELTKALDSKNKFLDFLSQKNSEFFKNIASENNFSKITFTETIEIAEKLQKQTDDPDLKRELDLFKGNLKFQFGFIGSDVDSTYLAKIDKLFSGYDSLNIQRTTFEKIEKLLGSSLPERLKEAAKRYPIIITQLHKSYETTIEEHRKMKAIYRTTIVPFEEVNLNDIRQPIFELTEQLAKLFPEKDAQLSDEIASDLLTLSIRLSECIIMNNLQVLTDSFLTVAYDVHDKNDRTGVPEGVITRYLERRKARLQESSTRENELRRSLELEMDPIEIQKIQGQLTLLSEIGDHVLREKSDNLYEKASWNSVVQGPNKEFIAGERVISFKFVLNDKVIKKAKAKAKLNFEVLVPLNKQQSQQGLALINNILDSSSLSEWILKQNSSVPSQVKEGLLKINLDNLSVGELEVRRRGEFTLSSKEREFIGIAKEFFENMSLEIQKAFWIANSQPIAS